MTAPEITDDAIREVAREVILGEAENIIPLAISEAMGMDIRFAGLTSTQQRSAFKRIDDAIGKATVTVTWPGEGGQDHIGVMRHIIDAQAHKLNSHIEQHDTDAKRIAELETAVAIAAELIDGLIFDGECEFDEDGNCPDHPNDGPTPTCPHILGRQFVEAWRAVQAEGSQS